MRQGMLLALRNLVTGCVATGWVTRGVATGVVAGCLVGGCGGSGAAGAVAPVVAQEVVGVKAPPRLVVLLVIDQFPAWSYLRYEEVLDGGLATLAREGTVYEDVELPYAATFTAPGHAALGTGAPPAESGILANQFRDPKTGAMITPLADPTAPVFKPDGTAADPALGASPRALRVAGIADSLEAATGHRAHTVTVAIKDRAAIMMGGQHPDLAVWYEPKLAAFTTSRYYTAALPAWVAALAAKSPIRARFDDPWTPLAPDVVARVAKKPDDAPGEGGGYGFGTTFPHIAAKTPDPAVAFKATPWATDAVLEAAQSAVIANELGADEVPDFLAVSFSAHDYAAHVWGQESWERIDMIMRIDADLAKFLAFLDDQVGHENYAVVLASDHGGTPLVEDSVAAGKPGMRVDPAKLMAAAEAAAQKVLGPGDYFETIAGLTVYGTAALAAADPKAKGDALAAAATAIAAIPGIATAAPVATLLGHCENRDGNARALCESLRPESGALAFVPARYAILSSFPTGTGHGSTSPEDRTIPVLVYAPGKQPARVRDRRSMLQVAPTVTHLLGVPPPADAKAVPLSADRPRVSAGAPPTR